MKSRVPGERYYYYVNYLSYSGTSSAQHYNVFSRCGWWWCARTLVRYIIHVGVKEIVQFRDVYIGTTSRPRAAHVIIYVHVCIRTRRQRIRRREHLQTMTCTTGVCQIYQAFLGQRTTRNAGGQKKKGNKKKLYTLTRILNVYEQPRGWILPRAAGEAVFQPVVGGDDPRDTEIPKLTNRLMEYVLACILYVVEQWFGSNKQRYRRAACVRVQNIRSAISFCFRFLFFSIHSPTFWIIIEVRDCATAEAEKTRDKRIPQTFEYTGTSYTVPRTKQDEVTAYTI